MVLAAPKKGKKINVDEKSLFITQKVKEIVDRYDHAAKVILFGSRARGDWHEESDWDFLILTDRKDTESLSGDIRTNILDEIELISFDCISIIVKNKSVWEEDYRVTTLYKSIEEEGLGI